jgi:hypothetical protein
MRYLKTDHFRSNIIILVINFFVKNAGFSWKIEGQLLQDWLRPNSRLLQDVYLLLWLTVNKVDDIFSIVFTKTVTKMT